MRNPKFKIGDWVRIQAETYLEYDNNGDRQIIRNPMVRTGQVCGAKRRMLGQYKGGETKQNYYGGSYDYETDYEQPYLNIKGSIVVWLIRIGYLNKPVEVLEEDIQRIVMEPKRDLPWLYINSLPWSESDKKELRDIMKDHPRDKKGRWM